MEMEPLEPLFALCEAWSAAGHPALCVAARYEPEAQFALCLAVPAGWKLDQVVQSALTSQFFARRFWPGRSDLLPPGIQSCTTRQLDYLLQRAELAGWSLYLTFWLPDEDRCDGGVHLLQDYPEQRVDRRRVQLDLLHVLLAEWHGRVQQDRQEYVEAVSA